VESVESAKNRRFLVQSERIRAKLQVAVELALEYQKETAIYNEEAEGIGAKLLAEGRVKQEIRRIIDSWKSSEQDGDDDEADNGN